MLTRKYQQLVGKYKNFSKTPRNVDKNLSIAVKYTQTCQQEIINSSLKNPDILTRKYQQLAGKYQQPSKIPKHVDKNVAIAVRNTQTCWQENIKSYLKYQYMLARKYQQLLRRPDMEAENYHQLSKTHGHVDKKVSITVKNTQTYWQESIDSSL